MRTIVYQIKLLEPVLVTALEGDPNSAITLPYLPGSVLRGAFLAEFLQNNGKIDAGNEEVRELFFNGQTLFINGYPDCLGRRSLPMPLSWFSEKKSNGLEITDFAQALTDSAGDWKRVNQPFFISEEPGRLYPVKPIERISLHVQRDRVKGRPSRDEGAVYRYISLQAGQTFHAAVCCTSQKAYETISQLIDGEHKLGGSRSGGYGLVEFIKLDEEIPENGWQEYLPASIPPSDHLKVTFLSDALIRNKHGQWCVDPEAITEALQSLLGVPLKLMKVQDRSKVFLDTRMVGGFNRKWGLPIPQAAAVRMGSVLVYERPNCSQEVLAQTLATGLGDRREEGFGRIAFDWLEAEKPEWRVDKLPDTDSEKLPGLNEPGPDHDLALTILDRLFVRHIEERITKLSNNWGENIKGPSKSQLSRLLETFSNVVFLKPEEGRPILREYFVKLEKRRITRDQFNQDRVAGKKLLEWLKYRVEDSEAVWKDLDLEELPEIGGLHPQKTNQISYRTNMRLVIATLARAMKSREQK